ncbi:hypothetical protein FCJ61_09425 [Burkholderia metallica]|uniref:hypothetical protein n=1 Tax=Burkholderia metallica TaxID=488729 RepID=UPI00157A4CAA|nr:hypothetical protein [Burkholderia metallica]NTZ83209.1 hypothetical protein [Burkholderia metallica]
MMKRFGANNAIGTKVAGIHRPDMWSTVTESEIRTALLREGGWLPTLRAAPRFGMQIVLVFLSARNRVSIVA